MKSVTVANIMSRLGGETTIPVGPLYIAAVLDRAGCDVDFRDYQVGCYENSLRQKNILDFLSDSERVLGISCLFNTLPFVLLALRRVKKENPEKTIILGGAGPSSAAVPLMERFPFVDVIVKGEGENPVEELAKGVVYKDVRGIVYRADGKVVTTSERERIHDLDVLPFPAYGKIDVSQYDHAGVITARGCVYHCSFCEVAPLWGHHTVQRSVLNVIDEIKMLHGLGIKNIHVHDDTFVLNRKWVLSFCDAVQRECPDITWTCNGRINLMDRPLLKSMADAGCVAVQYGIESGSQRVLNKVGKQIDVAQVKEVVSVSAEYMKTITTFMWGFPFETLEDLFQTVYLMGEVAEMGGLLSLYLLAFTPLSAICREYSDQLQFSEEIVSNLLWGVFDEIPQKEKGQIFEMIRENPDIFSGFYHIHTPDFDKKYEFLKGANLIR